MNKKILVLTLILFSSISVFGQSIIDTTKFNIRIAYIRSDFDLANNTFTPSKTIFFVDDKDALQNYINNLSKEELFIALGDTRYSLYIVKCLFSITQQDMVFLSMELFEEWYWTRSEDINAYWFQYIDEGVMSISLVDLFMGSF